MTALCGATLGASIDEGRRMQLSCKDALAIIATPETKVKMGAMPTLTDQAGTQTSTKAHLGHAFTEPSSPHRNITKLHTVRTTTRYYG